MLLILASAGFCVANSWADFANNLGSDLAPLIALFGEQVTTQYLSESFSILDNLVFALAPIGIITAMVAAIRVAGNAKLRSFIGRATESRGTVEADLMSSTSSDVCELWNGQGVVRVLGSPQLLQLICIPSKKDGEEAGIYELPDAVKKGLYGEQRDLGPYKLVANTEHDREMQPPSDRQNPPNLSLNININIESRRWAAKILTFVGVLLQGGVLVFSGLAQYKPEILDGNEPIQYGFPLFLTGTVSLAVGMFLCAQVIESSTNEYTYKPLDSPSIGPVTTIWVQKGGQTVGDQLFESFARRGRPATILVSHRSERSPNLLTIISVGTSLIGFITQFVGLRAMHATITVTQLGVVLLMTSLRSFAHMQRTGANDMQGLVHEDEEELNWLARSLLKCDSWDVSRSFPPPQPSPASAPPGTAPAPVNMAADLMIARARLAGLSPKWPSRNRNRALNLQNAIQNTMNYVFANMKLKDNWPTKGSFEWSVPVTTTSTTQVSVHMTRTMDENNHYTPWTVVVDQLEAMICLWASSLGGHVRDGQQLTYIRLLGPVTEHSEPDHELWINRGTGYETKHASEVVNTSCFGWWESVRGEDDKLHVTNVPQGDIEKHCTQDLYGWFIRRLMQIVAVIGGTTTSRTGNYTPWPASMGRGGWDWLPVENSSLHQLALYFVQSDLGTFEEAYFCLIPALRHCNILPYASVVNKLITSHFHE